MGLSFEAIAGFGSQRGSAKGTQSELKAQSPAFIVLWVLWILYSTRKLQYNTLAYFLSTPFGFDEEEFS